MIIFTKNINTTSLSETEIKICSITSYYEHSSIFKVHELNPVYFNYHINYEYEYKAMYRNFLYNNVGALKCLIGIISSSLEDDDVYILYADDDYSLLLVDTIMTVLQEDFGYGSAKVENADDYQYYKIRLQDNNLSGYGLSIYDNVMNIIENENMNADYC